MNLKDLLMKFHNVKDTEAEALSDFLMPILEIYPEKRASSKDMLDHPWLDMETTQFFVSEEEKLAKPYEYSQ